MMATASGQRTLSPRALVGKIFMFIGSLFLLIAVVLGGAGLFLASGATQTPEPVIVMVVRLLALIFGGVGLLMLLAGLVIWLLPGSSAVSAIISQYYAALANQDYPAAFQHLDPNMRTPQGTPITPAWFTQRASAYDAEQGPITNYALAGVRANPGKRLYIIKVTRRSGSYRTQLQLEKQGYDWKISGFDRF